MHTTKCQFCTKRIALSFYSKDLRLSAHTNRHPPKLLPTICPSADLPSLFISHFTNKVEKHRASSAAELITSTSLLVTGTTTATFYSFDEVSQSTVKECILSSAPNSC